MVAKRKSKLTKKEKKEMLDYENNYIPVFFFGFFGFIFSMIFTCFKDFDFLEYVGFISLCLFFSFFIGMIVKELSLLLNFRYRYLKMIFEEGE